MGVYRVYYLLLEALIFFRSITTNFINHIKENFVFEPETNFTLYDYKELKGNLILRYTVKGSRFKITEDILFILKNKKMIEQFSKKDIIKIYHLYIINEKNKER